MRQAIGFLIILWGLSQFFASSMVALDRAATASLTAIEAAAVSSQLQLIESQEEK